MKIRPSLTLHIARERPEPPPDREVQLDSLVERAEPHPEVERPIGFRRQEDQ